MHRRAVLLSTIAAFHKGASAAVPPEYNPQVVEAPFSFSERLFDLTAAVERSKSEKKPLLIYYGAADCPPCVVFERFLAANKEQLVPHFANVVFVDMRMWLRGAPIALQIGPKKMKLWEFNKLVGDKRNKWWLPYFWYLTPELKQIQQLPDGSGPAPTDAYTDIGKLTELLKMGVKT